MTSEERHKMYCDIHSGVRMMMDKVEKIAREKPSWSLSDLGEMSDILKDLASSEKDIAKASYYYSEHSDETY